MIISRRQFLKYCTVAAGALGLTATDLMKLKDALALEGGVTVTWIQGQSCTGCTVSLANSVYYATLQDLILNPPAATSLDLNYHQTLMAAMSNEATQELPMSTHQLCSLSRAPFRQLLPDVATSAPLQELPEKVWPM